MAPDPSSEPMAPASALTWTDAMATTWAFYREARAGVATTAPTFELVTGAGLDCLDEYGRPGFNLPDGCRQGAYYRTRGEQTRVVRFAAPAGVEPYMVAHELWHAALDDSTGDADVQHLGPGWGPNGEVEQALRATGGH